MYLQIIRINIMFEIQLVFVQCRSLPILRPWFIPRRLALQYWLFQHPHVHGFEWNGLVLLCCHISFSLINSTSSRRLFFVDIILLVPFWRTGWYVWSATILTIWMSMIWIRNLRIIHFHFKAHFITLTRIFHSLLTISLIMFKTQPWIIIFALSKYKLLSRCNNWALRIAIFA